MRRSIVRPATVAVLIIAVIAGLVACKRVNPRAEVEAAIQDHLKRNAHLMPDSFTTRFVSITVNGDSADALVRYESKNAPRLAVQVSYGLKKINGEWEVVSSSSAGGQMTNPANPHQGTTMDQTPPPEGSPSPAPSH